jgi:hypothetical protein
VRVTVCLLLLVACSAPRSLEVPADAGPDAGLLDSGLLDAAADSGTRDAALSDASTADLGRADVGLLDSGLLDSAAGEAGLLDAGQTDALVPDASAPDASAPDAAAPDTGPSFGCADYPANCAERDNWHPGLVQHHMQDTQGCSFGLIPPNAAAWTNGRARAQNLATRMGGARSIAQITSDLNRQGRSSLTNQTTTRLRNHNYQGWIWNSGDNGVSYWYPQGITGSSDAVDSGRINNRRLQLISWYHKTNARPTKGVRVSLADLTQMNDVDYRHMLLVVPFGDGVAVNYRPLHKSLANTEALHAGGIVWYGDYLYVADTANGFRVFDMSLIARVSHTDDTSAIGRNGARTDAFGYRYIIPQVASYIKAPGSCAFSYSFVSLDRSSNPPSLLAGEYKSSNIQGRLVHYFLDPTSHRIEVRAGEVRGQQAKMAAQNRMQGAQRWQGNYYISSSSQWNQFGRLYRTRSGLESSISAWVYGAEDLYYERQTGIIWTTAEHPDFRDVVGIPLLVP